MASSFKVGQMIERDIEEMWFKAVVEEVTGPRGPRQQLRIRYVDDGNIEKDVLASECRPFEESVYAGSREMKGAGLDIEEQEKRKSQVVRKEATLMKPLAGLIDDDSVDRGERVPTAIIHTSDDTEDGNTIILHGHESNMAAGGGLRALRFLGDKKISRK